MSGGWDTLVIGAGIGGLTASAHLLKEGLRVLILERNPHPGGTAYEYDRKGFTFPMGPLGFSHPGLIRNRLEEIGQASGLEFLRVFYRIIAFDLDIPLSLPFPEMMKELSRLFPHETQGIEQFFKSVEEILTIQKTSESAHHPLPSNESMKSSAEAFLNHFIKDGRLRRILGSIGTREPYSGLPILSAMWNLMCQEGIWYPKEGMKSFCDRFAMAVKRNKSGSGEIRLNTEVATIRVEKGKALGVILKDGTKIDSAAVISNADYKKTFIHLLGPGAISAEWYHAVSTARQTGSILQVSLGIDSGKADISVFKKGTRLIYRQSKKELRPQELDWDKPEIEPEALASQELEVSLWGRDHSSISREEKISIVIRTEADHRHFVKYRSFPNRRILSYSEYKNRLGRALIREIESIIPGLEKSIMVMDVATPLTFEDQGSRSGGAVAGWSWDYEDFHDNQPKELIRTPIHGLFMTGYQAFSALFMGGVPTAMESGRRAAQAVLEGALPLQKILIPGINE